MYGYLRRIFLPVHVPGGSNHYSVSPIKRLSLMSCPFVNEHVVCWMGLGKVQVRCHTRAPLVADVLASSSLLYFVSYPAELVRLFVQARIRT